MKGIYKFTVCGYELDSFGHVNNSVYLNYYEQARWELLKREGLYDILFRKNKLFMVLIKVSIKFRHELKIFDRAFVDTKIKQKGNKIISDQMIWLEGNERKISTAVTELVLVNENRIPFSVPENIFKNTEVNYV